MTELQPVVGHEMAGLNECLVTAVGYLAALKSQNEPGNSSVRTIGGLNACGKFGSKNLS